MASERVRIYELAKKLGLSNKEVMISLSKKLDIEVKSHSSTVTQEEAAKLTTLLQKKAPESSAAQKTETPELKTRPVIETKEQPKIEASQRPIIETKEQPKLEAKEQPRADFIPRQKNDTRKYHGYQGKIPHAKEHPFKPEQRPAARPGAFPDREKRPEAFQGREQRPAARPGTFPDREKKPEAFQSREQRPAARPGAFPDREKRPGTFPGREQRPAARPGAFAGREKKPGAFPGREQRPAAKPGAFPGKETRQFQKPKSAMPAQRKKDSFRKKEEMEEKKLQSKLLAERKKAKAEEEVKERVKEISIEAPLTVGELAEKLQESVAAVIKQLMMSGVLATVNQTIDAETAKKAAEALEFQIIEPTKPEEEAASTSVKPKEADGSKLVERAPVVTIMGHVDHGKTTLLDAIRKTKHKITSTEAGGITQSIGAYTAKINNKKIVFIDTPGHSAFTAMRARGARVTDIVILVVAADDGIMPQTIEAINHAKAAKVPIIIAVNKIDKDNADADRVLQQLTEHELVPEKWGGDTITVEVSALQGTNLNELLEYILLVSEIEEIRANPDRPASGVIIEAKLDKGKGTVATFLVQTGTLKVGDYVTTGTVGGKVRALIDDQGERISEAGPSTPVEVLGLPEIPEAGDVFDVVDSDKTMKEIINKRKIEARSSKLETMAPAHVKRETLIKKVAGDIKELNIIIKANTHGSAEAVNTSLLQLETKKIFVKIIHLGVGDISEADVMLASASDAIIIGFGVKEDSNALRAATDEGVIIRKYDIIYEMLEDIEQTMLGLLEPEYKEVEIGTAEVRQIFTVGKNIKIAGCYVLDGKIIRNKEAKVIRNGKEIYKGQLSQLKRFKEDVKEVASGYECGISFDKFNDIEESDIIKVLSKEEIKRHSLV